jgi:hypothetical protein
MQVAWVTTDIDRCMQQFSERFDIPDFFVADVAYQARLFDETGEMKLRLALANVDNMQIELIQPIGGGIDKIYREVLPTDGRHANVFHHVCVRIDGPLANWDAYAAELANRTPIGYTGDPGPDCRFVYTDERATLGIWLEHVWYEPEYFKQLSAMIPTYNAQ